MKDFEKVSDIDDGCIHTIKYSNGEHSIICDLDLPNYQINSNTAFFDIHYQNICGDSSLDVSPGMAMSLLTVDDLDIIGSCALEAKEIARYIEGIIVPEIDALIAG